MARGSLTTRREVRACERCRTLKRIFCGQFERYRSLCFVERPVPDWHSLDKLSQGGVSRIEFLEASQGFLHRTSFVAHPNLDIIRTLCLMVTAKQMVQMSCSAMDTSWCLTGLILRIAMSMGLHSARAVLTGMPILLQPRDYTCAPPPSINGCSNQALALSDQEEAETFHCLFERAVPLASGLMDLSHDPTRAEIYESTTNIPPDDGRGPESHHARHSIPPAPPTLSYWTSLDCALAILVHQRDLWGAPPDDSLVSRSFARLFWPDFLVAALMLSLYLLRADSPLDPPPSSRYCGMPARATLQDAPTLVQGYLAIRENQEYLSFARIYID
ncbi:hypothetical protein CNMCM5623_003152 [Aspergillus felis]|uniref:Transcription factor domain-containing protein n=1 Tax=Aspergillus felis TaxID=1287682 RepID=A0A8H6PJ28_9EURO|nr:hypothetical protein CNMCM5623_003152 [Aspergillus felis]